MKRMIVFGSMAMCSTALFAATDKTELAADLQIMSSILTTSLQQQPDNVSPVFRQLDALYLAKQGVVFNIETGGMRWQMDLSGLERIFPVQEFTQRMQEFDYHVEFDQVAVAEAYESAVEGVEEALAASRETLRELVDNARELGWEKRESEREMRDLKFEIRHAEEQEKQSLQKQLDELKKAQKELDKRQQALDEQLAHAEKVQKIEIEQRQAQQEQRTKEFLAQFEERVGGVLCKYGAAFKSLDPNEHVSFVLRDFSVQNSMQQDRVYVFNNEDIQACVTTRIKVDELLNRIDVYDF